MSAADLNNRASKAAMLLLALGGSKGTCLHQGICHRRHSCLCIHGRLEIDKIDPAILEELIEEFSQ